MKRSYRMSFALAVLAGAVTGALSSWGIGGGTLLVLYMSSFTDMRQQTAQGINLLYFLPTAIAALV
ncbi:MAG: sulfite exporter TauE/SafE family protein, partial [Oscillospiraceae bacterium]|nr:sulfite exporter TauE/SafE family protein [Oscillospiraceae bacterium]